MVRRADRDTLGAYCILVVAWGHLRRGGDDASSVADAAYTRLPLVGVGVVREEGEIRVVTS
jgi:hypothetical protein